MVRASIIGAGMTEFGVHESTLPELFADAALLALDDAGVNPPDVEALYFGNAMCGLTSNDTHTAPKMAAYLGLDGIPCQRFEDACASSSTAFKHAVQAVESGTHDVVLVGGAEHTTNQTGVSTPEMTRIFGSAAHREYEQSVGMTFPGMFALLTKRHMARYGTTEEQLAAIAVKNHYHGSMNSRAQFGSEIDIDDVLESPLIADPFHLLDCCPFSDGASAVVVTSEEYADSYDDPVDVTGIGHANDTVPIAIKDQLTRTDAAIKAADAAYAEAGIKSPREEIDFAEVHDCFTGAEVMAIEALGFYDHGEGAGAAAAGETRLGGEYPVNPSGGLKAKGHPIGATGTAQLVELTEQLRGASAERQVAGAETAVAHNMGGDAASAVITILEARS
jgi:acetyl-CoA acetyltransferase